MCRPLGLRSGGGTVSGAIEIDPVPVIGSRGRMRFMVAEVTTLPAGRKNEMLENVVSARAYGTFAFTLVCVPYASGAVRYSPQ